MLREQLRKIAAESSALAGTLKSAYTAKQSECVTLMFSFFLFFLALICSHRLHYCWYLFVLVFFFLNRLVMTQGQLQDALQRLQKANEAEKAIALRLKDVEDMLSDTTARFYEAKSTIDQLRTDNEALQHEKREAAHQNQALLQVVDSSRRRMSQVQGLLRQTNQVRKHELSIIALGWLLYSCFFFY